MERCHSANDRVCLARVSNRGPVIAYPRTLPESLNDLRGLGTCLLRVATGLLYAGRVQRRCGFGMSAGLWRLSGRIPNRPSRTLFDLLLLDLYYRTTTRKVPTRLEHLVRPSRDATVRVPKRSSTKPPTLRSRRGSLRRLERRQTAKTLERRAISANL